MNGEGRLVDRVLTRWGSVLYPSLPAWLWMAGLLGTLAWLDHAGGGVFLVPPFAATLTILVYLPGVSIAQPLPVVCGSGAGAALGTGPTALLGFGPGVAMVAALSAAIVLPLLRVFHPPGIALAMYPALLHPGPWFAGEVVLPFTLAAVTSAALMSRMLPGFPRYPRSMGTKAG
jgi:CBS domain-containing membrane protein